MPHQVIVFNVVQERLLVLPKDTDDKKNTLIQQIYFISYNVTIFLQHIFRHVLSLNTTFTSSHSNTLIISQLSSNTLCSVTHHQHSRLPCNHSARSLLMPDNWTNPKGVCTLEQILYKLTFFYERWQIVKYNDITLRPAENVPAFTELTKPKPDC